MSEEKKTVALDESTLEGVTGGGWSPAGYKDYGPQRVNDSADQAAKDAKDALEKLLKSQQEDMEKQP